MSKWTDPGKPWSTTDLPENRCPLCGYRVDAASAPGEASPNPGDSAVCMSCASVLVFDESLRLRKMSRDEFTGLHPESRKEISLIQRGIRMLDRRRLKGSYLR